MASKLTRRDLLQGALGAATAASLGARARGAEAPKPNILFVFSDQQRWDTLGCLGELGRRLGLTPRLDQMAAEGVLFENAMSAQPVCGPTRSIIQTGRYATQTGCFRNGIHLPEAQPTIAHRLREGGYEVGYIGKWHLASTRTRPVPPARRGGYADYWLASDVLEFTSHSYDGHMFDAQGRRVAFPKDRYRVDCLTDFAIDYLRSRDGRKPFFLFLSYIEPHHQNDHGHFQGPRGSKERFKDFPVPGDLEGTKGDWRREMPDYLGCCASLDQNLGRLRAELRRLGIAHNTLVLYASDHGCHFRTRNREYKRSCHEASIHVPLVACGPGFRGGRRVSRIVSLVDVAPTVLTAAGLQPPPEMHGRPLQELAAGKTDGWPPDAFVQISESHVGRALRTPRWKYSVRARGKSGGKHPDSDTYTEDFLYDLEADPHERANLVGRPEHRQVADRLKQRLIARMAEAGEAPPTIHNA
ncbi:MAG: sulfatase-like hydrolase/transferase [Candidatus Brocadiia bacterium]